MIWVFGTLCVLFLGLAVVAIRLLLREQRALCFERGLSQGGREGTARTLQAVATRTAAETLRLAADRWDSVEEQANLIRLANERYTPGGPSMPVIWLRDQADKIEGAPQDEKVGA